MALFSKFSITVLFVAIAAALGCSVVSSSVKIDELKPAVEMETQPAPGLETAVFAGGCFWGVEAVFENIKGVADAKSGYSGGDAKSANYDKVSGGKTPHAEVVKVIFDPAKVTYQQLLEVFFTVAHDPTELNRQGPDTGPQYRSAIFYTDENQKKLATEFIADLDAKKVWSKPIVTQIVALEKFYDAEAYHQNYLVRNPTQPYIVTHDMPKLENLKKKFPDLYAGK